MDDAGPGIEPAERSKVFERFYRGSASGRRGTGTGTGLGLSLVAEHLRAMHGQVRVESSPAGGARLVVVLPVLATDGEREEAELARAEADGEGANGAGRGGDARDGRDKGGLRADVGEERLE